METATLRQLIRHAMLEYYPKATLWPNGLGFDYRGWTWSYSEANARWYVSKTVRGKGELRVSYHPTALSESTTTPRLGTPLEAVALFRPFLQHEAVEVFMIALLDSKLRLIAVHTVSRGGLDMAMAHPRDVFKAAVLGNAASIITAHNHPSGDPTPSQDDLHLFARLEGAAEILGVPILDHVIIGSPHYWSRLDTIQRGQGALRI
mgnify:CR=1 FL=1